MWARRYQAPYRHRYLIEVYSRGLVRKWDWLLGLLALAAYVVVVMLWMRNRLTADKRSIDPLPFGDGTS